MKNYIFLLLASLVAGITSVQADEKIATVYVDKQGVMRWSDTKAEASFFGVNYTLPFAHAYRAMGYLDVDRKSAIDRDVYHMARLGINAYRIHVWDVEISDSEGHLLTNEHLDLLDYLLSKLEERGIRIVITLQTNFGNGYPERNEPTGGYSYLYDKCSVHQDPDAIAAQERYAAALVRHVNAYTGKSYKDDPYIIGFEINNEPCHPGTLDETRSYIETMLRALKRAGNRKPVFYNVSHNGHVVQAYYDTDIQGTTYQWYPTGLVSGRTRTGNLLPAVDRYDIPFSNVKGFSSKARLVYEFDPGDVWSTYLYPATVRTFRSAGFQWITQFAYDPIDMAAYNTEYQTHYLNTAYTPGKAVGLMIAAEVAQQVDRGEQFPAYPADTTFHGFRVSYAENLSELDEDGKFYYTNNTRTQPQDATRLKAIAGCGSSPVVDYEGTGMYWLDRLEEGVWRLEVMPDAMQVSDPFAKPSLDKKVVQIIDTAWDMTLTLPDLGETFSVTGLNEGNTRRDMATHGLLSALRPGVYLLQRQGATPSRQWTADSFWRNIRLGEYVQPSSSLTAEEGFIVRHRPFSSVNAGEDMPLEALIAGAVQPDSVLIYTDRISFWNQTNPYLKMQHAGGYTWKATVPASELNEGVYRYNIVVFAGGRKQTFPSGTDKEPLDWDYTDYTYWETRVQHPDAPLLLMDAASAFSAETFIMPEWSQADMYPLQRTLMEKQAACLSYTPKAKGETCFLRRYVKEELAGRTDRLTACKTLCLHLQNIPQGLQVGVVSSMGYTYMASCPQVGAEGIVRIPLTDLKLTDTALLPLAFPSFLDPFFHPEVSLPLKPADIETLELRLNGQEPGQEILLELGEIWLE
ncbi:MULTISPECIES: hypothetical protein [Bacteroides]|uniref:hypothetical protein n=1 Tax=Bacteroides TaxID=816 RepID=UPI000B3B0929|nr:MULTISPECIES: hypothetical protein [Bacteroides]MBM6945297.1 hypothetical protein [Bacteroides gallinaceum]OUO63071.1 hypothetical protein B5F78_01315 [Bacteroides sp. An279]